MASRAASCVAVDRTQGAATITVEAPHECDAGMERDGVVAKPPTGRGERSWWLGQLVEATPLGGWTARFGGRTPEEIVTLPVADDWQGELHAAWCRAAVRQRDAIWSRALLGAPASPDAGGPGAVSLSERAKLLGALPDGERAAWVAGFIATHGLSEAFQLLGVCAQPWAEPLGRAVVDALNIARDAGSYPWSFSGVMGLAERCLDPAEASRLDGLTATPDEPEDAAPGRQLLVGSVPAPGQHIAPAAGDAGRVERHVVAGGNGEAGQGNGPVRAGRDPRTEPALPRPHLGGTGEIKPRQAGGRSR